MTTGEIISKILNLRGITNSDEFFNPPHPKDIKSPFDSLSAIDLIKKHIALGSKIAIYGDYDVDGICSTAILWETLYSTYKNVFPHIPHREAEGYGLSIKSIDHCLQQGAKLIIAVDNGIVAFDEIDYCKQQGCDIIIIDHHEPGKKLPEPSVLLHSISACAAGLTWLFCRELQRIQPFLGNAERVESYTRDHLALVAIATICDLVPLLGVNRSFAKHGLGELNTTERPGLLALFNEAKIRPGSIGAYEVGFMLGPRLNAMGRLEHAIDSLRLLCTKDTIRARQLAQLLNATNQKRQTATDTSVSHALAKFTPADLPPLLLSAHTSYHPGIIGLIAAKLVENYRRPGLAISIGETTSKGSGRSIPGFHLTKFLRQQNHLFIDLGGHALACGFTIKTDKLDDLAKFIATAQIQPQLLIKKQRVDLDIPLELVNWDLWLAIQKFEPFGLGNPTPIFQSTGQISDIKTVGKEGKHIKFRVKSIEGREELDAIWFNPLKDSTLCSLNSRVNLTYSISKDTWNGQDKLQLIVKDLAIT